MMNNNHRIALVVSNLEHGGAERQVVYIANGLSELNFEVHVISLSKDNPLTLDINDNVYIHIVDRDRIGNTKTLLSLHQLFRIHRIDLAHGFLFDAEILTRLAGTSSRLPLILGSERNANYAINRRRRLIKSATNFLMDICVANSYAGMDFHRSVYGLSSERYRVVRNGVDISRFKPQTAEQSAQMKRQLQIDPSTRLVGMFASMKAQKNHEALIHAAELVRKSIPNVMYLVVGGELEEGFSESHSYAQRVKKRLSESIAKDEFIFLGKRTDVEKLYCCCEITALPSWHEGLPNVLLESIACGVPVVATDVADNRLLLEELGVGRVVAPGDDFALASAITDLLTEIDNEPNPTFQINSVRAKISIELMITKISEIYRELILGTKRQDQGGRSAHTRL